MSDDERTQSPESVGYQDLDSDMSKIKSLQDCLNGIPPPPSITNPRINLDEVLPRLKSFFEEPTPKKKNDDVLWYRCYDIYFNNRPACEVLDSLYQKFCLRCITHETSSITGTVQPNLPPPSPLTCDIIDLLPRSVSSPASPAPDLLSLELVQRRNNRLKHKDMKKPSPRKSNMLPIKNPNLRLAGAIAHRDLAAQIRKPGSRAHSAQKTKLQSRLIAVDRKLIPPIQTTSSSLSKVEVNHEELSDHHKKKLLWATTTAFKDLFPVISSDQINKKRHLAALYRLCQAQWLIQRSETAHISSTKGTSERMLELAIKMAPTVIDSLKS